MKKIIQLSFCLFVSLLAVSCSLEKESDYSKNHEVLNVTPGDKVILTANIEDNLPTTRTQLGSDGRFLWTPDDKIKLIFGEGAGEEFTAMISEPSATSQFEGSIHAVTGVGDTNPEELKFWGIYPFQQSDHVEIQQGTASAVVHFPEHQWTGENTWGQGQFIYLGQSPGLLMGFKNISAGYKFFLERDDIQEIHFRSMGGDTIAGDVYIVMSEGVPSMTGFNTDNSFQEIILYPPQEYSTTGCATFKKSDNGNKYWYYLAVPPMNYSEGIIFTFHTTGGLYGTREFHTPGNTNVHPNDMIYWSQALDRSEKVTFLPAPAEANQVVYYAPEQLTSSFCSTAQSHEFNSDSGRGVLTFESPVTEIPASAFAGTAVTDVLLPEGLTVIGESAFSECGSLTSITLPETLQYLGAYAFDTSGLESVAIPESVQYIGCTWDASSGEVTNHAGNPFTNCASLASFSGKFATSDGLFLVDDGYLVSGAIGAPALGEGKDFTIPYDVTTVGNEALAFGVFSRMLLANVQVLEAYSFFGCANLAWFEMGRSVTEIGSHAFAMPARVGTGPLGSVNFMLMENFPSISSDAFEYQNENLELRVTGWQAQTSAVYNSSEPIKDHIKVYQHWDEVWLHFAGTGDITDDFLANTQNKFLQEDGQVIERNGNCPLATQFPVISRSVIPEELESLSGKWYVLKYKKAIKQVAANAFSATGDALDWISLPDEVTTIGASAFEELTNLKKFPGADNPDFYPMNNITSIGERAFNGCSSMAGSVPVPYVTSLGANAFYGCKVLTDVTLGAVPVIPNCAFTNCKALVSVTLSSIDNLTEIGLQAFHACTSLVKVCAADNTLVEPGAYVSNVTSVGSSAFSSTAIPRVSIAAQVTLGLSAFANCSNLHDLNLPNVHEIPYGCFMNCTSLSTTNIGAISTIGERAFYGCSALQALRLVNTNNLTEIGSEAFNGCTSLQAVGPTGITFVQIPFALTIGTSAFGNTAIRSVSAIRATDIGASAFAACPNLVQVSLNAATTLPHSCFYNDAALTTVNVSAVTTVSTEAFYRCTSLPTLNLPAVVTIGDRAFAYTKNLADLEFGENLTTLGQMIFFDDSTDGSRNYGKLELTFAGPYPTSLYSASNGTTPTFAYTDSQQDLFIPKKVYVNEDYFDDYLDNFPNDWNQSINALVQQYRP